MSSWLALAMLAASPAASQPGAEDPDLAGFQVVPDAELAEHRGGFSWQGVEIGLGAEVRTYLDGQLVLQTNISWTPAGTETTQIVSGALSPADASQLQAGVLATGGITMRVGDQSVFLANEGQTAILHRTDGAIQNIILNRASNLQVSQEVDAVLDLGNFAAFQADLFEMRLGEAVGDMVGQSVVGGY